MASQGETKAAQPLSRTELELIDAWWRAANYLSVGQIYLLDNPLLEDPLEPAAHQAAAARPLGHHAGAQFRLRPPEPRHQGARSRRDLHLRAGARRSGHGRQHLARRHLQRALPEYRAGQGRDAPAVPPVQLSRRHPEPRRTRDPGVDPRGRRTRLLAVARLWRRVRQSRSARRLRDRRRRGRNRAARRPPGTATSSSTRRPTGRCCRSCI